MERMELPSTALVKFAEKLHILETAGVHIRSQQINSNIERMSYYKYD